MVVLLKYKYLFPKEKKTEGKTKLKKYDFPKLKKVVGFSGFMYLLLRIFGVFSISL